MTQSVPEAFSLPGGLPFLRNLLYVSVDYNILYTFSNREVKLYTWHIPKRKNICRSLL